MDGSTSNSPKVVTKKTGTMRMRENRRQKGKERRRGKERDWIVMGH